jgi:putative peptidoglycan lipid II flippase
MVQGIIKFFNKEFEHVSEAALILGGFAFLSQLLGLVRDRTLAHVVHAGPMLDVYYAAFRIPDFLYISIASLASVTVLLPFLVERIKGEDVKKARLFLNNLFTAYMLFMSLASICIAIFMPVIAKYIAPGFTENQLEILVNMSRIMLLSPIFIGLSNLIGSVTQLYKKFFIFSLSPIFYNLGILSGIIFFYPIYGVYGLAIGVVLGACMHLLIQVPFVFHKGFMPSLSLTVDWKQVYEVIKISLPRTFTLSITSLAFMFLISIASTLHTGSISLFTFAFNLQSVPVGIIGISYTVACFPVLVKSFASKNINQYLEQIIATSKQIIFWSLPVMALMIVLRAQIVRVVLGTSAFSWQDTRLTAASVALFVLSLISQSLVLLFVRAYYAAGKTKKPLIINTFSAVMVVVFSYGITFIFRNYPVVLSELEILLRVKGVVGTSLLALPLAYALGSLLNFFLLFYSFKKDFLKEHPSVLFNTFFQNAISAFAVGVSTYYSLMVFDDLFVLTTGSGILLQGLFSGIVGITSGVIVLVLFKNEELMSVYDTLSRKFSRKNIVVPEQGEL